MNELSFDVQRLFAEFDVGCAGSSASTADGQLSRWEFVTLVRDGLGVEVAHHEVTGVFAAFDHDGDNRISCSELAAEFDPRGLERALAASQAAEEKHHLAEVERKRETQKKAEEQKVADAQKKVEQQKKAEEKKEKDAVAAAKLLEEKKKQEQAELKAEAERKRVEEEKIKQKQEQDDAFAVQYCSQQSLTFVWRWSRCALERLISGAATAHSDLRVVACTFTPVCAQSRAHSRPPPNPRCRQARSWSTGRSASESGVSPSRP